MSHLLHLAASPRGAASESLAIAGTFLGVYREHHPDDTVETWDLWDRTLPSFGPEFGRDFQSTYLEDWLTWTGIDDISEIRFHPTLVDDAVEARSSAHSVA